MVTKYLPILLLLDNQQLLLSLRVLDLVKKNGMVLVSFPTSCTHNLKTLCRAIY
jgi:hypothetical protein